MALDYEMFKRFYFEALPPCAAENIFYPLCIDEIAAAEKELGFAFPAA